MNVNNGNEILKLDDDISRYSNKVMASYGINDLIQTFIESVFGAWLFYYYEAEIGLDAWLITLGFVIFVIRDAINDPIIGYLTDRNMRFTRKWGKRFPWIMIGAFPLCLCFIILFTVPDIDPSSNPWPIFSWLVVTTCLFDTFYSLFNINVRALFPDKFRTLKERTQVGGYTTLLGMLALPLAMIIPPMIIRFGKKSSYINLAFFCAIVGLVSALLMIPGVREDKKLIQRYYEERKEKDSFIETLKSTLKQKNFLVITILYFTYGILTRSLMASIAYAANFLLKGLEIAILLLAAGFLIGGMISIPFWIKLSRKVKNNKTMAVIGGLTLAFGTLPLAFFIGLTDAIILVMILGFCIGNFWTLGSVYFADVLDEYTLSIEKNKKGTVVGVRVFIDRFTLAAQAIIFAAVHTLTGFPEGAATYSEFSAQSPTPELALIGIRLHMAVIPAILVFLGTLVFWKWYDLTPTKMESIRIRLNELNL